MPLDGLNRFLFSDDNVGDLMSMMRTDQNVVLAGGQGKMSDDIFRIGHLGHVTKDDIDDVMEALSKVLPEVGFTP